MADLPVRQRAPRPIDPGTRIGHVHLRTADIDRVRDFYVGVLGFDVVAEARESRDWPPQPDGVVLDTAEQVAAVRARVDAAGIAVEDRDGGFVVRDPWEIPLLVSVA